MRRIKYQNGVLVNVVLLTVRSYYQSILIILVILLWRWSCYKGNLIIKVISLSRWYSRSSHYQGVIQGHLIIKVISLSRLSYYEPEISNKFILISKYMKRWSCQGGLLISVRLMWYQWW